MTWIIDASVAIRWFVAEEFDLNAELVEILNLRAGLTYESITMK